MVIENTDNAYPHSPNNVRLNRREKKGGIRILDFPTMGERFAQAGSRKASTKVQGATPFIPTLAIGKFIM